MASPAEIAELVVRFADEELHRALVRYAARTEAAGLMSAHGILVAAAFVEQVEQRATRGRTTLPMLRRALETDAGFAELEQQVHARDTDHADAFEAEVAHERAMLELVARREP